MNIRARTDDDKNLRKQAILDAAKELFIGKGYYGTTVQMITKHAGISTGTFYLYYKNKGEIFKALQLEGETIISELMDETLSRPHESCAAKIRSLSYAYLDYYAKYRDYFEIIAVLSTSHDDLLRETESEISKLVQAKTEEILKKNEDIIVEGINSGEFQKDTDPFGVTITLWAIMDGLAIMAARDNAKKEIERNLRKFVDNAVDVIFTGLLTK